MQNQDLYGWPVKKEVLEGFSRFESPVHKLCPQFSHACDFIVPLGTVVLAMFPGEIIYVKQDSNQGGSDLNTVKNPRDSRFWALGNRIEIHHGDRIYTSYEHLAFQGSLIEIGDKVEKNQPIARTGYTGLMAHLGPHLHVEKLSYFGGGDEDFETLRIHWGDYNELLKSLWDYKKWREIGNSRML